MFFNTQINKSGIYGVNFCINGEFQVVVVDDFIPYDQSTNKPVFSRTKNGTFWLSILEKAWAKIHGTYKRTVSGNESDAYLIMTGAPTQVIDIQL
jgi:calpain-15